jgi:hypothetical protein
MGACTYKSLFCSMYLRLHESGALHSHRLSDTHQHARTQPHPPPSHAPPHPSAQSVGLGMLLDDRSVQSTLLVPVTSALSAGINAAPLREERTLADLIRNAPEVLNPLIGYSGVTDAVLVLFCNGPGPACGPTVKCHMHIGGCLHAGVSLSAHACLTASGSAAAAVLRGLWPSNTLTPGARVPTTASIDKVSCMPMTVSRVS